MPLECDVLIVDDEEQVCQVVRDALTHHGLHCEVETDPLEARRRILQGSFLAVVTDVSMPGLTGMELLRLARSRNDRPEVVLITGLGNVEQAKQALRDGAFDYLEKPFDIRRLSTVVMDAIAHRQLVEDRSGEFSSAEALIQQDGARDGLTGLGTPRLLQEKLTEIRLASVATRDTASLVLADVDDFAEVNRIFGYAFGDEVLRQIARRIQGRCGGEGSVCRLTGDQIAIVLPCCGEAEAGEQAEQLRRVAERMELKWKDHPVLITLSLGVAETGPGFSIGESELIEHARLALHLAKRGGGNQVQTFSRGQEDSDGPIGWMAEELSSMAEKTDKLSRSLRLACLESVRALATAVEAKDPYTLRHSEHVAYYAEHLARHLGLPGDMIDIIRVAALVHDIGKIGIADDVLTKPGSLTSEEFEQITMHPNVGGDILEKISLLRTESRLVRYHHERWDGSGYPEGLAGEQIPAGARIICLADSLDAMLMPRTYKPAMPVDTVLAEIERCMGTHFDPQYAEGLLEWISQNPKMLILPDQGQSKVG